LKKLFLKKLFLSSLYYDDTVGVSTFDFKVFRCK